MLLVLLALLVLLVLPLQIRIRTVRIIIITVVENKATTMEEDEKILQVLQAKSGGVDVEEILAVNFRLEKKRLLKEAIGRY